MAHRDYKRSWSLAAQLFHQFVGDRRNAEQSKRQVGVAGVSNAALSPLLHGIRGILTRTRNGMYFGPICLNLLQFRPGSSRRHVNLSVNTGAGSVSRKGSPGIPGRIFHDLGYAPAA